MIKAEYNLIEHFCDFIHKMEKGKRMQKNGKLIGKSTLNNYKNACRIITLYENSHSITLSIKSITKLTKRELQIEKRYWSKFYISFTHFLYNKCNYYDNYVRSILKSIRTFFNYMNDEMQLNIGLFHKKFYVNYEEIEILVLTPERLKLLIYSDELESKLTKHEKQVKAIFVFGCTVSLRFSDLMSLKKENIEFIEGKYFLKVLSKKTQTFSRVKLPDYTFNILNYFKLKKSLFPKFYLSTFNNILKNILEKAGFTEPITKVRRKRGVPIEIKNTNNKCYRFCDLASSHLMRRTAITNMLCLGMSEGAVRQISGHARNSSDFYKYVKYSQAYLDKEVDKLHNYFKANTIRS